MSFNSARDGLSVILQIKLYERRKLQVQSTEITNSYNADLQSKHEIKGLTAILITDLLISDQWGQGDG
jgi:hypothetical protein